MKTRRWILSDTKSFTLEYPFVKLWNLYVHFPFAYNISCQVKVYFLRRGFLSLTYYKTSSPLDKNPRAPAPEYCSADVPNHLGLNSLILSFSGATLYHSAKIFISNSI